MHNHNSYHSLNADTNPPTECRWWCRMKNRLRDRLGDIGRALLSGNVIKAITDFAGAVTGEWRVGVIDGDDLLTPQEKVLMEQWQDNVFEPFLRKVESLLAINNYAQRNLALKMLYAYEFALKQQAQSVTTSFDGFSKQALNLRHVYVKNVIADITNALSTKPSVNTQFNGEDVRSEILATSTQIARDLLNLRGNINGLLYVAKTGLPPDNVIIIPVDDITIDPIKDPIPVKPTPPSNSGSTFFKWLGILTAGAAIVKVATSKDEKKSKKTK